MKIVKKQNGTTLEIALDDRLDNVTAPELDKEIKKGFDGVKTLIWDLRDLEYITSAGLRELMLAQKMLYGEGTMKVVNASEMVLEVFRITGLDYLIDGE